MINNIKAFGKFLDQPILISKLNDAMPAIMLTGTSAIFGKIAYDTYTKTNNKNEAKKDILKKGIVLYGSAFSALVAPKIAGKLIKRAPIENIDKIKENYLFNVLKSFIIQRVVCFNHLFTNIHLFFIFKTKRGDWLYCPFLLPN